MATPPTFIQEAETVWNTDTSPKNSGNFTTQTSDVVVACSVMETGETRDLAQSGTNVSLGVQQTVDVSSYCEVEVSAGVVASGGTTSVSFSMGPSTGYNWGGNALTFRGSDGIGASSKTNVSSGAPSLDLSTTQDNSAIVVVVGDWNAADGSSRTWRTVNSITPTSGNGLEVTYYRGSTTYTVYIAYYSDAGAAGTKTVGLSAPSGQKYSIVALEVKGAAGGATTRGMAFGNRGTAFNGGRALRGIIARAMESGIRVPPRRLMIARNTEEALSC